MDFYRNSSPYQQQPQNNTPLENQNNTFTTMAVICGIISFLSVCSVYLPFLFGSLAILFAILSKGKRLKCSTIEKLSILAAVAGIVSSIATLYFTYSMIVSNPDYLAAYLQQIEPMLQQTYGMSAEELMQQFQFLFNPK